MKPMRVMLVDDEHLARERLARLLSSHADIEIVGEAQDGEQAAERILELQPELVFLDIQMPGCSGMELAASLPAPRPRIIFCTAFDEYAVEAFELHAVDYLLKPVTRARLAQAIERVRAPSPRADDTNIEAASSAGGNYPTRFLAKRASRFCVIPQEQVLYFSAEGGVTRLQTGKRHYWMQPTLAELEQRLDPARHFRVSRSTIVHLDAICEVVPQDGGQGEIRLSDDSRLEVSRRRFKELISRLES